MARGGGGDLISGCQGSSAGVGKSLFSGGTGHWGVILWGLDNFLIFPNFLRFLSRSATREATRIYHVYK